MWGYAASRVMNRKNRNTGAGWALGLLLGLWGLVIAALVPRRDPEAMQTVHCHRCRASQIAPARITLIDCEQCETEIALPPAAQQLSMSLP